MEWFAEANITDPMFGLIAVIAAAATMTLFALLSNARTQKVADPLTGLFDPSTFEAEFAATQQRKLRIQRSGDQSSSVLRGRIDHLAQVRTLWSPETRAEAVAHVAQVMRAGVRNSDAVTEIEGPEGGGSFAIQTPGANEAEAGTIAKRLLETLARTRVNGIGDAMRLSASFGVAERREGESDADMRMRADDALKAAQVSGEEQVITATEWEEVMLLPAPAPSGTVEHSSEAA